MSARWIIAESIYDELLKSQNYIKLVIPAKAGIQSFQDVLDFGFRLGDIPKGLLQKHHSF
jgi:hypothetical protein